MGQKLDEHVDLGDGAVVRRRFKPRRLLALARPMVRPYTLDLEDPICLNMIPMDRYSITGAGDMSWSYITDDSIPQSWIGQQIDGTLVSWSSGARFTADGVTLRYGNTAKWGPCVGPAIN